MRSFAPVPLPAPRRRRLDSDTPDNPRNRRPRLSGGCRISRLPRRARAHACGIAKEHMPVTANIHEDWPLAWPSRELIARRPVDLAT
jgi:hypothetical protein